MLDRGEPRLAPAILLYAVVSDSQQTQPPENPDGFLGILVKDVGVTVGSTLGGAGLVWGVTYGLCLGAGVWVPVLIPACPVAATWSAGTVGAGGGAFAGSLISQKYVHGQEESNYLEAGVNGAFAALTGGASTLTMVVNAGQYTARTATQRVVVQGASILTASNAWGLRPVAQRAAINGALTFAQRGTIALLDHDPNTGLAYAADPVALVVGVAVPEALAGGARGIGRVLPRPSNTRADQLEPTSTRAADDSKRNWYRDPPQTIDWAINIAEKVVKDTQAFNDSANLSFLSESKYEVIRSWFIHLLQQAESAEQRRTIYTRVIDFYQSIKRSDELIRFGFRNPAISAWILNNDQIALALKVSAAEGEGLQRYGDVLQMAYNLADEIKRRVTGETNVKDYQQKMIEAIQEMIKTMQQDSTLLVVDGGDQFGRPIHRMNIGHRGIIDKLESLISELVYGTPDQ